MADQIPSRGVLRPGFGGGYFQEPPQKIWAPGKGLNHGTDLSFSLGFNHLRSSVVHGDKQAAE